MTTSKQASIEKRIAKLLARPYLKMIRGDATGGFLASAPELPGCITAGETEEEALVMLHDAMAAWFESVLLRGLPVPEPSTEPLADYARVER